MKMVYGVIYKITNNINGTLYYGQTMQQPPQRRWSQHIQATKKEISKKEMVITRAMRSHGIENFKFEIIYKCETLEELNAKEIEYIATNLNGYNVAKGGDNHTKSPETRLKMSAAQKGRIITKDAREKLRKANLGKKQSPETLAKKSASRINVPWSDKKRESMLGRKNTDETKIKMSKAQKGRVFSEETKKKMREAKTKIRKITDAQIIEIRENKDNLRQFEFAKKYNVSKQLISNIINHKRGY